MTLNHRLDMTRAYIAAADDRRPSWVVSGATEMLTRRLEEACRTYPESFGKIYPLILDVFEMGRLEEAVPGLILYYGYFHTTLLLGVSRPIDEQMDIVGSLLTVVTSPEGPAYFDLPMVRDALLLGLDAEVKKHQPTLLRPNALGEALADTAQQFGRGQLTASQLGERLKTLEGQGLVINPKIFCACEEAQRLMTAPKHHA